MPAKNVASRGFDFGGNAAAQQKEKSDSSSNSGQMQMAVGDGDSDASSVVGGQAPALTSQRSKSDDGGMKLAEDSDESGVMQMGGGDDEYSLAGSPKN